MANILKFQYEGKNGGADYRWDEKITGLGVRVYPSGKKTFIFRYRYQGRQEIKTLGDVRFLNLEQARGKVQIEMGNVIKGERPLADKIAAKSETIEFLCKRFLEIYCSKLSSSTERCYRVIIKCHILPAWGHRKISSIKPADVNDLHNKIGVTEKHSYQANRMLSCVSGMFKLAALEELIDTDIDMIRGITKFPEEERERYVTQTEMPLFISNLFKEPDIYFRTLIFLYLYTGVRKSGLLTLTWANVDFKEKQITVFLKSRKKNKIHRVPLSEDGLKMLKKLPQVEGNPYVFPSPVLLGIHIKEIKRRWHRLRKISGVADVRIHDLRRTFGSWLAQMGDKSDILIGGLIGQAANSKAVKIYTRMSKELRTPQRNAVEELTTKIKESIPGDNQNQNNNQS